MKKQLAVFSGLIILVADPWISEARAETPTLKPNAVTTGAGCDWLRGRLIARYESILRAQVPQPLDRNGLDCGTIPSAMSEPGGPSVMPASPTQPREPSLHFLGTNTREAGIDESDIVKTDGTYVYVLRGNEVVIVRARPEARVAVAGRVQLGEITPLRLLLSQRVLLVIGTGSYAGDVFGERVIALDVTDPARPKQLFTLDFERSNPVAERRIGTRIVLVGWAHLDESQAFDVEPSGRARRTQRHNKIVVARRKDTMTSHSPDLQDRLRRFPVNQLLPRMRLTRRGKAAESPLFTCGELDPGSGGGNSLIWAATIALPDARTRAAGFATQGSVDTVYATEQNLFVTSNVVTSPPAPTRQPGDCSGMGGMPAEPLPHQSEVEISKLALAPERNGIHFAAQITLAGRLLNQFALDEHRGFLRVAIDENTLPGILRGSALKTVAERAGRMEIVGTLDGLAPGEEIYAARLDGDIGYLVTFPAPQRDRRVDPLFTLDLADPKSPKVVGELAVPGFSNYIHPVAGRRLLTVGQDTDERGVNLGAQLQLFDARNLKHPTRVAQLRFEPGSRSLAQRTHLAFLADPTTGIVVIPLEVGATPWTGAVVARVTDDGLITVGRIDHGGLLPGDPASTQRGLQPIARTMLIDGFVLTLSSDELRVHRLPGLETVAAVGLAGEL